MRQPTDLDKIVAMLEYHKMLMEKFKTGKLKGKIDLLLADKAREIGIGIATYYRRKIKVQFK